MRSKIGISKVLTNKITQLPPQSQTASVSTILHRCAVCDEYVALDTMVSDSIVAETERERQEAVRIRVESMLRHSDLSSLFVLSMRLVLA